MKEFFQLMRRFVAPYKKYLGWAILLNILSAVLNVFSFTLIIPILQILFKMDNKVYEFIPWDASVGLKEKVVNNFEGLVILDEAYSDFSDAPSFLEELDKYPNLVVFQTFSKAWGCAAIRLGMAFASVEIIGILSKIKYPYNVNQLTQQQAISMLHKHYEIERWVKTLKEERDYLEEEFEKLPCTIKLFPSDANFFLVKVTDAVKIYNYLVGEGIIVRNRHSVSLCCNCLRVTVGTRIENNTLLAALRKYEG